MTRKSGRLDRRSIGSAALGSPSPGLNATIGHPPPAEKPMMPSADRFSRCGPGMCANAADVRNSLRPPHQSAFFFSAPVKGRRSLEGIGRDVDVVLDLGEFDGHLCPRAFSVP